MYDSSFLTNCYNDWAGNLVAKRLKSYHIL